MASEPARRAAGGMLPFRVAVALALFATGIAAAAAARHGYYANLVLAGLACAWLTALSLRRDPPPPPPPAIAATDTGAIQAELRRLRFMLDHAPVPLVLLRGDGAPRAINRAARGLFATDDRIVDGDGKLARAIAAARPGERLIVKLPGLPDRGHRKAPPPSRSYAVSVAAWSAGQGPALLASLVDIQPELHAAESSALRDLLQTLSHEIMNSLTPVMSLAETAGALLTEKSPHGVEQALDALETIARRARGLDRFVRGYQALARVPAASPRPTSISRLLRDLTLLFSTRWAGAQVALAVALPEPDIVAAIDADLIGQALMALLTNAAEAALAGAHQAAQVTLAAGADATLLWFRVTDSGAGVPPEDQALIFRPLFTRKLGGTGIGLGLARQIVRGHGGDLTLEPSPPNTGAVFAIHLP